MLTVPERAYRNDSGATELDRDDLVRLPGCSAPTAGPVGVRVGVRRRRVTLTMLAIASAFAVSSALSGAGALMWASVSCLAATAGYLVLVSRLRRVAALREVSSAFGHDGSAFDWQTFAADPGVREVFGIFDGAGGFEDLADPARGPAVAASMPGARVEVGNLALARFVAAYAAGWLLTPLVALIRLAGGDLSDLDRHHVVERLVRLQRYGRSQSLKVLAVGAAATVGVTTVGGLGAAAFASPNVAASAPPPTAQPNAAGSYAAAPYTVRPGDTLASIAVRYGTTWQALAAENHLSDPALIFPGQVVRIGGGPPAAARGAVATRAANPAGSYTVRPGDTLEAIASRFATTWQTLASINRLSDPALIMPGQVLRVGGWGESAVHAAPAQAARTPAQAVPAAAETNRPAPAPANTTLATTSSTPAASSAAAVAVKVALEQVGKPYVWGGAGPNSFDCSGLVMFAYAAAGVALPHYSVAQYQDTARVSQSQLQPGDIVFYDNGDGGPQPGHESLYIGNGQVVSADTSGTDVRVESMTFTGTPMAFGRVA